MLSEVGDGVEAFWQDRTLLDYTIQVEQEQFRVHKLIMASVSDYFKAMLTGGMVESQTDTVRLVRQNPLAVSNMIEYIYTGQFGATQASTEELLACAMYLQITPAIDACCQLLCDKINAQNALDILAMFEAYNLEEGVRHVVDYIRSNIEEVLNVCKFEEMSRDKLQVIIDCWGESEWKLFLTIKKWLRVDLQNRNQHLNDLLSQVRFALMTPDQLEDVKDMDIRLESDASWRDLVTKAEEYHKLPIHLKVLDESEQCTVRADPTPLCFEAEEESDGVFHALEGKSWIQHKALNHPEVGFLIDTSVVVNNFYIARKEQKWYAFNPRTKRWSTLTEMPVNKSAFCLVHCGKQLYTVGGNVKGINRASVSTDSIERYDFETNNWSVVPNKMPLVLEHFSACSLNGCIYIAGGSQRIPGNHEESARMDCFDPTTNTWSSKAPMPESFQDGAVKVLEFCKEDVIFLMDRDFYMQYYRPTTNQWCAYDPLHGNQTNMVDNLVYNWNGMLATSGNTLYLIDFFYDMVHVRGEERESRILSDDNLLSGACQMWMTRGKGQKAFVKKLDRFPLHEADDYNSCCTYLPALLALAPQ